MNRHTSTLRSVAQSLLAKLPSNVRAMLQGGSTSRLLKKVDVVLLVFDDRLYDLSNASWRTLKTEQGKSEQAIIAEAAASLLGEHEQKPSVLLLLPPQEFIATRVNMPGVTKDSLRAALHLQSSVLLPSYESPLVFTVNTYSDPFDGHNTVIWADEGKIDALFSEFHTHGLFLLGVMPRHIAAAQMCTKSGPVLLCEEDNESISAILYQEGVVSEYLQVMRSDLEDPDFARQWQDTITDLKASVATSHTIADGSDYCQYSSAEINAGEYSFIPAGARQSLAHEQKGKRIVYAAAAAIIVVLLASSPFLLQSLQLMRLDSALNTLQASSTQAREDQALVREFEISWGVLNEFPRQHIPDVLLQLQSVLSPNVLTSIEIDEGSIEIEGESNDPQSLLQLLEQDSMFTGVDFARATNNNRYYIEMRLSTVDYDAYRQRYFPDVRR